MWVDGKWCYNPIIPTIFDDSLSYYEVLCKLRKEIEDLRKKVEGFEEEIRNYVETAINNLTQYVDSEINRISQDMENLKIYVDSELEINLQAMKEYSDLGDSILKDFILQKYSVLLEIVKQTDALNRIWTLEEINKVIDLVNEINEDGFLVYNPFRGYKTKMQVVINDIYNLLLKDGLTAIEYDYLNLTAKGYDDYNLTAYQYDFFGKRYLDKEYSGIYMFSPFTGLYTDVRDVVLTLSQFHLDGVTAIVYDNLNLTAEIYDSKNLTAYQYDSTQDILKEVV